MQALLDYSRELELARRAGRLLEAGRGITTAYALAAINAQALAADELRGEWEARPGRLRVKRWYLA